MWRHFLAYPPCQVYQVFSLIPFLSRRVTYFFAWPLPGIKFSDPYLFSGKKICPAPFYLEKSPCPPKRSNELFRCNSSLIMSSVQDFFQILFQGSFLGKYTPSTKIGLNTIRTCLWWVVEELWCAIQSTRSTHFFQNIFHHCGKETFDISCCVVVCHIRRVVKPVEEGVTFTLTRLWNINKLKKESPTHLHVSET